MSKEFKTFEEFWPFYLSEHSKPLTRQLHFVGTLLGLCSFGTFVATRKKRFLALAPVLGYGLSWVGHFMVEKNRPATFKHPGKSLRGDFKMLGLMAQGKLGAELEKAGVESAEGARSHD